MTVKAAIERLQKVLEKHGDVEVYFDCPSCNQAFTPGMVATQAVVLNGKPKS